MPDFDKNLQPIIKKDEIPSVDVKVQAPNKVAPIQFSSPNGGGVSDLSQPVDIFSELKNASNASNYRPKGMFVTDATLEANKRYRTFNPTIDNMEDFSGYGQSGLEQAANGILKGANLVGTTIAGGFGMIYGTGKSIATGKLSDIWNNEILQGLDEWNNKVDNELLPNFYTDVEKNANWYSTKNWFTPNFLFDKLVKNSGFAIGAMVSGNIANAGLLRAGALLGKAASAGAIAAESSQAFKLFTPLLRNTSRAFSSAKNLEAYDILRKEITSIADLTARSSKLAEIARVTNKIAGISDGARRTIIAAYSSAGEAAFEGLQTASQYKQVLIDQYKKDNAGQEPLGEDLKAIESDVERLGNVSFLGNLALLGVTEYVQLPYLMGSSYSASRRVKNSLLGQVDNVVLKDGKYVAAQIAPSTKFGKIYQKAKGVSKYIFDPKEAGQEIGQYALQVGAQNYFRKGYEGKEANVWVDGFLYGLTGVDERGTDVGALVSKEGIESGILGGITGGLMQAKGRYKTNKATASNTSEFLNQLNSTPYFKQAFQDRLASTNRSVVLQQQHEAAIMQDDKLEAKDIEADMMHNYLSTRIKYGRFDMVMDDLAELKQTGITEQGLASLKEQGLANINDTTTSFQQRISALESTAKNTEQLYRALNLRYSGEILTDAEGMPVLSPEGKQLRKYSDEVIDKLVYASSKIADYDLRIPQVNSGLSQAGISTMDVLQSIILDGKPNKVATEEALSQINNLDVTSDIKDELKTQLSDMIELSLRRKLFIEEYDDIKKNPLNYTYDGGYGADEKIDTSPAVVEQKEKIDTELQIGKEYSLKESIRKEGSSLQFAPKITVLSKTLGGEFEVRLPNGKIKFLTPTEFKNYNISDDNNSSQELADILDKAIDTVLAKDDYAGIVNLGLIPGETKLDFINSLDNQKLIDDVESEYNKQSEELRKFKEEQEQTKQRLLKNSEQIKNEQAQIENNSGNVSTPDTSTVELPEGKLKSAERFFVSGITESEDDNDPTQSAAHIKRSREFLNNTNNFPNREKLRAILVTPNQLNALGLTGLIQTSYNVTLDTRVEDIPGALDVENGFVAQVFVIQKGKDLFFVDKNGKELTKVGEQVNLDEVVFQTMPTTKLTYANGKPRYRSNEKEEFERSAEEWKALRKQLFSAGPDVFTSYEFDISRGIPYETKDSEGNKEKNHVGSVLVPENKIATQEGLIVIPTTGFIVHKGENLSYSNGVPVLQYGDTVQFLNNRKFNNREAKGIYQVIKALAEDVVKQSEAGKPIRINREYSTFLQNVLYWKSKSGTVNDNQIYIDVANMTINLGKESYSINEIANNETQIVNQLENAYNNINSNTLTKSFSEPFVEHYINKDGEFTTSTWKNYQSYLLSSKYPNGSSRTINDTPLSTSINKPTEAVPYSFKQKYATLIGVEFPVTKITPKAEPITAPKEQKVKIGEYTVGEENVYQLTNGIVTFTPTISSEGFVEVSVTSNDTIKTIAENKELVNNVIVDALKQIDKFNPLATNEELVLDYVTFRIAGDLQKQKDAQAPVAAAPVPVLKAQQAPIVSDETEIGYLSVGGFLDKNRERVIKNAETIIGGDLEKLKNVLEDFFKKNNLSFQEGLSKYNTAEYEKKADNYVKPRTRFDFISNEYGGLRIPEGAAENNVFIYVDNYIQNIKQLEKFKNPQLIKVISKSSVTGKVTKSEPYTAEIKLAEAPKAEVKPEASVAPVVEKKEETPVSDIETKSSEISPYGVIAADYLFTGGSGVILSTDYFIQALSGSFIKAGGLIEQIRNKYINKVGDLGNIRESIGTENYNKMIAEIRDAINSTYNNQEVNDIFNVVLNNATGFPNRLGNDVSARLEQINSELTTAQLVQESTIDALEEKKPEAPKEKKANKFKGFSGPSAEYRTIGVDGQERMTDAEFQLFKEWHVANVPNIPFEVLNRIITTATGEKAWGAFENGVAKFVKGGLRGTEYHEIGEAIWNGMLSKEEQEAILADERTKSGTFKDRASGKTYSYDDSKVSDKILKERIMDDFADYRLGKLPARSLGEKVRTFFKMIMDFFKSFVTKPSLKEELFKAIDAGKFKDRVLKEGVENEFAEYRAVEGLTEQQTHEFVQDMTARAAGILYKEGDKKLLFSPLDITADQMFDQIEQQYANEVDGDGYSKIDLLGEEAWNELKTKTKQSLRTLGISFDESNKADINNEDTNKNDYAPEPFTTDWKKTSTGAIKFSLATLIDTQANNQEGGLTLALPAPKLSSVGGYKLLNFGRTFATLLDKLGNTTSVNKVLDKVVDLSNNDPNYVRLYYRLGGKVNDAGEKYLQFKDFTNDDWRYFIQFTQTFTKQKPEALIQYKSGNEVYFAPANLYTAIKQTQQGWIENIKTIAKEKDGLIKYNKTEKTYQVKSLKGKVTENSNGTWTATSPSGESSNHQTEKDAKAAAKKFDISIKTNKAMIKFLGDLGINFDLNVYNNLKVSQKNTFTKAVNSIYTYLGTTPDILSVSSKTLGISGPLSTLAELYNKVTNPNQESTYFGVENQRIGSFAENNNSSVFENEFNESETLDELLSKRPELNDIFSTNSQVLKKGGLFFNEEGVRIRQIKIGYIQGTKIIDDNKGIKTTKLGLGDRFTQEINNNLEGNYYILLPGDSSTEWMMNLGNTISFKNIESGKASSDINSIFKGYLSDDVALALDSDNRNLKNIGNKGKELRFFKDILFDKQLKTINDMIESGSTQEQIEEYINSKEAIGEINNAIQEYIKGTVAETRNILINNNQVYTLGENEFSYPGIIDSFEKSEKLNKNSMSSETLDNILTFTNVNYIINNIEYHKVLFGDPFQFAIKSGKLDETKRIKSFLSPRRTTFDSAELNTFLNENFNKAGDIQLSPGDPGYTEFKSHTNTISVTDVTLAGSLSNVIPAYAKTNEADAASWLMDNTYREIKIKNGQWTDEAEAFHQWQMAYTRQNFSGYKYTNSALENYDKELISKSAPKHKIEVLKPIVSGNKFGENKFNLVLDKFSQMPIYYSMVEGTNLEKLYKQMFDNGIGYAIVESGRKVGVDKTHTLYNPDGSFNEEVFSENTIVKVPWKAYGIQVETVSEDDKEQTRGSQLTKLSSMDLFDNGVPTSEVAQKEYLRNKDILDKMHENAYNELLVKLGVEDMNNGFKLVNGKAVSETLMYEMLRREVSDNTIDAIQLDENDQFKIPFEAAPSYIQIRNIMYSIIDKALIRPKMNGGAHVQVPVTMFESATKGRDLTIKTDKGWVKISKDQYAKLSDEQKKKVVLTDSTLKFYTKENPYCEILLPHWFKNKFNNKAKFPNDEAILKYLNSSPEGRSILKGIGFRIPTQALSSVEVFRVKGFLPEYMGSTVVVPSEITTKAGSDFDIDKLNMYLKSTYVDRTGNVRLVNYLGSENDTKEFYGKVFDDVLENKAIKKSELLEALQIEIYNLDDSKGLSDRYSNLISSLIEKSQDVNNLEEEVINEIENLSDKQVQAVYKEKFIKDMYKKSLENEYYDSLEKLITLPENFNRLISPVDDAGLEKLSEKLNYLRGYNEDAIKNRILNRNYMTTLRNTFVMAKKWVGIAAVNITNLSLKQKSKIYIDPARFTNASIRDQKILGDGNIILKHNTVNVNGQEYISLSGTTVKGSEELISNRLSGYATSFVDVANKPYITDIIQSDLVVGTFMFLENIGAGEQTAYFLNQPIITEYLKMLDSTGAKGLFNKDNIEKIKNRFGGERVKTEESFGTTFDVNKLEQNIKDYYGNKNEMLNPQQEAEQEAIFNEFLKYAKMAEYAFKFTQATNYDTTSFKNSSTFARKTWNTDVARESNIISSVDDILKNTFIGNQKDILSKSMQAMGAIFKLEQDSLRIITDDILKPYGENTFMSSDDFEKLANKVKADFLDYIIQTKTGINSRIKELLVDPSTSVATRLEQAKKDYPDVQILKEFQVVSGDRVDGAKSVKLIADRTLAYDNDLYVGMMRELRDYNDDLNKLYNDLVNVAILQGTYQSAISIKDIIPIEDYSDKVGYVLDSIVANESLDAFSKGMFYINNFKDDTIMPIVQPKFFATSEAPIAEQQDSFGNYYADIYQYYSSLFPNIEAFSIKSSERKILLLSEKWNAYDVQNDFIKVPRVVTDKKTGESIDMVTGQTVTKLDYAIRKSKGDQSLKDVFGYAKVKLPDGTPLTTPDKQGNLQHVYKLVNLQGDSPRTSEYYDDLNKQSVLENGTIKMNQVIPDEKIIEYYGGKVQAKDVSLLDIESKTDDSKYAPEGLPPINRTPKQC